MGSVSGYRVCAVGADPSHMFGSEARDSDLPRAAWHGRFPLTLVEFARPGVARVADAVLAMQSARPDSLCSAVTGDAVLAHDVAGQLTARGARGLTAFTNRPGDGSSARLPPASVALFVGDDFAAYVDWLRVVSPAVVDGVDRVGHRRVVLHASQSSPSGDLPVKQRCGLAVGIRMRSDFVFSGLLEAPLRIGHFDPAVARR